MVLNSFLVNCLLGGTSASVAVTIMAPLERIKLLLQAQKSAENIPKHLEYKGVIDCFKRIPKEQGITAYWRGNWVSVLRCFPYQALNFSLRDLFRNIMTNSFKPTTAPQRILGNVVSGGLAGVCALTVIYPLDYARTRMAVDIGKGDQRQYKSVVDVLVHTYKKEGRRGLYRGYCFSILGVFIYRAGYFGLFDTMMNYDGSPNEKRHSFWMEFLVAEISSISGGFASYPVDTVRRSMMMQSNRVVKLYTSSSDCVRKIYAKYGIRGFFYGGFANVLRGTGGALGLVIYDNIHYHIFNSYGDDDDSITFTASKDGISKNASLDIQKEQNSSPPPDGSAEESNSTERHLHFCSF